ncbi:sensor histidine kinase [Massilia sp. S19_KUP03_FR1]|uniref:sensor histidine kinase n=1 Tax=Massilia sp. S19_KUP03_FR1 TaxID=3025503 RepID=UPI002FCD5F89
MSIPRLRRLLALVLPGLGLLMAVGCAGAAPLRDYRHTSWGASEGLPAQISALAQTPDGWLWLGTADDLYRFDGVAFEHVAMPTRGMLARRQINTMHVADNGELWIAHVFGGVSVLRAGGRFDDIADSTQLPVGTVNAMASDSDGSLWAASNVGVFHLVDGAWQRVVDGAPWPVERVRSLLRDQDGTLWATFAGQTWRLDRQNNRFAAVAPPGVSGALLQSPDGRVWATRAGALVQVSSGAVRARAPRANQSEARWGGQFDRHGNLWQLHCPTGACVLPAASAQAAVIETIGRGQHLAAPPDISSANTEQVLEDREGNVWIATDRGLDRYQANRLLHSGLPDNGGPVSLAADADGAVWAAFAGSGALFRLTAGGAPVLQPGRYARVVGTATDGALLLAGKRSIERRLHGAVTQIALPPGRDGQAADLHVLGLLDDGKVLWMAAYETGLMGYVDGQWRPRSAFNLPAKIVISAAGARAQLWLADGDGGLSLYDDGKLTRYDALVAGIASAVFAGPQVMVAGEHGLAVLQQGALRLLRTDRPDVLRNISGMAITPDGDRWFNGAAGLVHVRAADWARALAQGREVLRYTLLDARDGYPGQASTASRLPSLVQAPGGQLWIGATEGVVQLDTRGMQRNPVAPVVQIAQVSSGAATWPLLAGAPVQLPPAAQDFNIAFTAPALRRPEALRFAWWLEGVDRGWVDGGTRRSVSYTHVAPGSYRFHLRATNEDGVASAAEISQAIVIAPTLVQSAWFKALCALLLLLAGVGLYRYRIALLTARLSAQLQVRASERERIARTLHDTYLQSVNALMLRVRTMAQSLPGDSATRARLETVLVDASNALVEGRDQVEQLRAGGASAETLERLLARSAGPLRQCYPDVAYAMEVRGTARTLAPAVLMEAGQVAAEALRNAFIHAGATHIAVRIDYADTFTVAVVDDGKGLDDEVRRLGYRSGHWGLLGMRERAKTIGATLAVTSAAGAGTSVTLSIAAARAYEGGRSRWRSRSR